MLSSVCSLACYLTLALAKHLTIPLTHHSGEGNDLVARSVHAVAKHARSSKDAPFTVAPNHFAAGAWYGSFDVGDSKNLTLQVDTGSAFVLIERGYYEASAKSIDLNKTNSLEYGTAFKTGCGRLKYTFDEFEDTVVYNGLVARGQRVAKAIKTEAHHKGVVTTQPPREHWNPHHCQSVKH